MAVMKAPTSTSRQSARSPFLYEVAPSRLAPSSWRRRRACVKLDPIAEEEEELGGFPRPRGRRPVSALVVASVLLLVAGGVLVGGSEMRLQIHAPFGFL